MPEPGGTAELVGRNAELARIRAWVERARAGPAGLLLTGEPGIGKSTIWRAAAEMAGASGARVVVSRPVEAELPYGYAALGDLLVGVVEPVLSALPAPQARALEVALSMTDAPASSDPLLVGRALVGALRLVARETPVVLAIDDAQWLDAPSGRALAFAARRLEGLPIGVLIALRSGHPDPLDLSAALGAMAEAVPIGGLSLGAIGRLVRSNVDEAMSRISLLRIHERSAGNPLYALQLARAGPDRLPASLAELMASRLGDAPPEADRAIELVAVLGPLRQAAFDDPPGLDAAVASSVLEEQAGEIRFSHPLLAAAAYERIPPARRQALHRLAAEGAATLEARAQHLALATTAVDESIARSVEAAARTARARGAVETAVALAAHARRLTPREDVEALARRTMDAADYLFVAADERAARQLVDEVLATPVRGPIRVRALVQRALTSTDPAIAVAVLEEATREPHDDRLLRVRTLAQLAWQRGAWLGDVGPALEEARRSVAMAEGLDDDATLVTALTTLGLITSLAGRADAASHYRRALEILARTPTAAGDHTPRLAFASERWWRGDFATAERLLAEERALAIEQGDEGILLRVELFDAELALRDGRWDEAERLLEDVLAEARDYWRSTALMRRAILRSRRGHAGAADDASELRTVAAGDPIIPAAGDLALGLVAAAEGRFPDAAPVVHGFLVATDRSGSRGPEFALLIPEAVAILVAAGWVDEARALAEQLERRHEQLSPWADAATAFCRGMIDMAAADGPPEEAETLLATAREGFAKIGAPWELAQTLVAEGSLFRRLGRRRRAGDALDQAIEIFGRLGAEPARLRAVDELRRARPRPRSDSSLTAAEVRVAALVANGTSNREVAAQLFTTVATVEAHLTHIYAKLGIRSRTELARRVSDGSVSLEALT